MIGLQIRSDSLSLTTSRILLLLLILNKLNVVLWHVLIILQNPLFNILAQVTLDRNLLAATRHLGDARARGEFLTQGFGDGLDVEPKGLEARDAGDVFTLVALDALDDYGACGALLGFSRFGCFGLEGFLVGVLFGALLGIDGEGAEAGGYGVCVLCVSWVEGVMWRVVWLSSWSLGCLGRVTLFVT